jgi:hypothetical protein
MILKVIVVHENPKCYNIKKFNNKVLSGGKYMEWAQASANTPICEAKNITLRDVVQTIIDGASDQQSIMDMLQMDSSDIGAELIPEVIEVFLPVVKAYRSGGCGSSCGGCSGCGGN